ncbi:MAG: acyl-CoA dehydrogenase family protein [Steroidobacteraceae bacterium]
MAEHSEDPSLRAFRSEVREWLEANVPASIRTPMPETEIPWGGRKPEFANPESSVWLQRMAARGFTAPSWPRELGGAGLSLEQVAVLSSELQRVNARPSLFSFGLWMLGPVLLEYGTKEQRLRFLPPIARGEIRWCQGYSEPGAGSDLAALRTRAEDRGDHWLVNGQKVWTSYADKADWMFCLVRTDATVAKHRGISFLLLDMATPGVSARPIRLISGASPFCETFFDNVRVPKEHLVGPLNGGWEIAKKLLQYERQNVSAVGFGADLSARIEVIAKQAIGCDAKGHIADAALRERVARCAMSEVALGLLVKQAQRAADTGQVSALTSVVKYLAAKVNQERQELAIELLGFDGLGWEGSTFEPSALRETRRWLRSKGNSIEGGTSEINLNIIAKRVLQLPDPR